MKKQLHEFYVTRKCTKYEYFTVKAESMEEAKYEAENGFDYYDFDWEEVDYESDYGEYNEVIDEIEEEVFADTQLSLEGVLA